MGELKKLKAASIGPFDIFLNTDRRDENNQFVMEEYDDPVDGRKERREREKSPFMKVWYKKNFYTPKMEDNLKMLRDSEEFKDRSLNASIHTLVQIVSKWDLTDNGEPVPLTVEGILAAEVPGEVINPVVNTFWELQRPPKALNGKSPSSFSQEE